MARSFRGLGSHVGTTCLTYDGIYIYSGSDYGDRVRVCVISCLVGREIQPGEGVVDLQRFCDCVHAFSAVVELQVNLHVSKRVTPHYRVNNIFGEK